MPRRTTEFASLMSIIIILNNNHLSKLQEPRCGDLAYFLHNHIVVEHLQICTSQFKRVGSSMTPKYPLYKPSYGILLKKKKKPLMALLLTSFLWKMCYSQIMRRVESSFPKGCSVIITLFCSSLVVMHHKHGVT